MLVARLELSYYRQFENEEIYFPLSGLIGFRGVNGAGKSTLFNLLDWILWGKYKGVNQNQLKMHKSPKNAPTYGVADIIFNGDFYRIRRDLVNSKSRNYVEKNKNRVATGTTQINSYIRNLFGMDQEAFRVCYYASQFDFDALTQMKDAPRAAMISKLLRIETIDETAKKSRDDRKKLEIEINEAKRHLRDEAVLIEELKQIKEQEKELKKQQKSVEKDILNLEKERDKISLEKEKSDKIFESFQKLSLEISNLETKQTTLTEHSLKTEENNLQILQNKKKRLDEIAHKKEYYFSLLQKKDDLNEAKEQFVAIHRLQKQINEVYKNIQHYEHLSSEASSKLAMFDEVESSYTKLEQEIAELEDTLAVARDKGKELQTMLNVNKNVYKEIMSDKQKFGELGEEVPCPTCKRPLGEHLGNQLHHLEEKRQEIIQETAKMKVLYDEILEKGLKDKQHLDQLKQTLESYRLKLREKSGVLSQINVANQEIQRQNSTLQELQQQRNQYPETVEFDAEGYKKLYEEIQSLTPIYEEIIQLQNQVQDISKLEESITYILNQLSEIKSNIHNLCTEREQLDFDKENHDSLSKQIDDIRSKIDTTKDNRYTIQSQIDKITNSIESIQEEMQKNTDMQIALKDKQQEIIELAKLDELYKAYKQDTLAELAPKIADKMSDMIEVATDGLYNLVELDEFYNIYLYRDGEKHPLEIFSGGEQKLAALLQRIAVSQLLVEQTSQAIFDMIALDEVTSAFDETRQDAMLEMLRSLNGMFQQILLVSHNEHVKDSFDHTLLIERGPNKKSTARWALTETGTPSFDIEEIKAFVEANFEPNDENEETIEDESVETVEV